MLQEGNAWTKFFMIGLSIGANINNALEYADSQTQQWRDSLDSTKVMGNIYTTTAEQRYICSDFSNLNVSVFE